jgi:hypothetical protein
MATSRLRTENNCLKRVRNKYDEEHNKIHYTAYQTVTSGLFPGDTAELRSGLSWLRIFWFSYQRTTSLNLYVYFSITVRNEPGNKRISYGLDEWISIPAEVKTRVIGTSALLR